MTDIIRCAVFQVLSAAVMVLQTVSDCDGNSTSDCQCQCGGTMAQAGTCAVARTLTRWSTVTDADNTDSDIANADINADIYKLKNGNAMNNLIRIFIVVALAVLFSVAAKAQISVGGNFESLDKETVIEDLSSPEGSGNIFIMLVVHYPDGSDSTFFFVASSPEAVYEASGIKPSEVTTTIQFTDVDYIRSYLKHFITRFPKLDLWICVNAEKK